MSNEVREPVPEDAPTLALGAMLLLAAGGTPTEELQEMTSIFTDGTTSAAAVLDQLENLHIKGRQVFLHEDEDDTLAYDLTELDATEYDLILALIARAVELRGTRRSTDESRDDERRAREIARSIRFANPA